LDVPGRIFPVSIQESQRLNLGLKIQSLQVILSHCTTNQMRDNISVDNAHSNNGRLFEEYIEEYDGMKGGNRAEFDSPTMPNEIMMNFDRDTKEGEAEGPGDQELVSFMTSSDLQ